MDFDAESSSTEAVAFMTVSEAGAAEVPQNVADKSAARGEEAEKEEEPHNTAPLKSEVSNVGTNFGTSNCYGLYLFLDNLSFLRIVSLFKIRS